MTKLIFKLLLVSSFAFFILSCESENSCDTTCGANQIQSLDCLCFPENPPDCTNTCPTGQILTADCTCYTHDTAEPCGGSCPTNFECINNECVQITGFTETKTGFISVDETWSADTEYILANKVVVEENVTLTIEPGTIIKGSEGNGTLASALVIQQGARIDAQGTPDAPIIFTSILDNITSGEIVSPNLDENESGLWGGLIVLGRAPISVDGDSETSNIEGIPVDDGFGTYGGTDPMDDSGILTYVSVRHGGVSIGSDNEINGVTFGGVGAGTIVDNIEVTANLDDGIEWFGGTVNCSNLLVWAADDDALDLDQAYSGTIDNAVVIAFGGTDHCLEFDGPEGSSPGLFTLNDVTVKGFDDELGNMRDGATGAINNAYFFGFSALPADNGEGDFAFSGDNTFAAYADGELTFSGFEFSSPVGATISAVFPDFTTEDQSAITEVQAGANTVGADTNVFGWTTASQSGALDF
jgi:hypothetical protein